MRLPAGGWVDRTRPLTFRFNGRRYTGLEGDTLASALLANGVHLVGRSFKYHRPRGVLSAGVEEPNAIVQLVRPRDEPNVRATTLNLVDGLEAHSVNCWPGVGWDLGAASDLLSPLLPAGFYYKTFMGLPWDFYSRYIRRMAGLGRAPKRSDATRYEKRHHHCDVMVIGAGPAGLAAASAAAASGARVLLVDAQAEPGGSLLVEPAGTRLGPVLEWAASTVAAMDRMSNVLRLANATAAGYYDHNLLTVVEQLIDGPGLRERLWHVRAAQVVIAAGAVERPLVFPDNDRPGIMLVSAARAYVNRYAVNPGRAAVVFTNNGGAYGPAFELADVGIAVKAIVDSRARVEDAYLEAARERGIAVYPQHVVVGVRGRKRVVAVTCMPRGGDRGGRTLDCDLLCMSGGWSPLVHLHSQSGARPRYDARLATFVPGESVQRERSAGSANGPTALGDCLDDGARAGSAAAAAAGYGPTTVRLPDVAAGEPYRIEALWAVDGRSRGKAFVDFQNDVTRADLDLALRENYRSIEHVKRYTTAGMATDQGKAGNVNVIGIVADRLGATPGAVGTTTYRPPFAPVSFGALAGKDRGQLIIPARTTPITRWHVENGGAMSEAGSNFRRPFFYRLPGESDARAIARAALAVRRSAGIYDGTPLGKFELFGPDVRVFLNRIYTNRWDDLALGRGRFGLMLREDGRLFDDGVTFRLDDDHYLMSTGTGAAGAVYMHMERLLQTEWTDLKVYVVDVTSQWVNICVCGPNAREVLAAETGIDLAPERFKFMDLRHGEVAGVPARIARVGYTGELSFEVNVYARHGLDVWQALMRAGEPFGITPVGSETSNVLRIEKGFVAPAIEGDNLTNPDDAGMGWAVDMDKGDFIGRRSLLRDRRLGGERQQVVGLLPDDPAYVPADGSALVGDDHRPSAPDFRGHVTAACFSPTFDRPIALALLKDGRAHLGKTVTISGLDRTCKARVTRPVFYDPKGERMRA